MQNDHPEVKFGKTGVLLINFVIRQIQKLWSFVERREYL